MAKVNHEIVRKVAAKIRELPLSGTALTFTEEDKFPAVGEPGVLDYIFAVTMYEFGAWISDEKGYVKPLYGEVNGKMLRGSDLLWTLSMKTYEERGPEFFNPNNLAKLSYEEFMTWLPEEYGYQDLMARHHMTLLYGQYARSFTGPSCTTLNWMQHANKQSEPLDAFLSISALIPGYDRDPLFKKNLLLAMTLANRPEKFLKVGPNEAWPPIIDYHLMRVALRLGMIDLLLGEHYDLQNRVWISAEVESNIRDATYEAVRMIIELSEKPMSEVDFLMWDARRYCPEMTIPDCPKCVFTDVCQKRIELFQPVFRTTNY